MTARTVRRLCRAYEAHGPAGLVSQSRGRRSNRHRRACRGELIQVSSSRSTGATTTGSRTVLREPSCWCSSTTRRASSWRCASSKARPPLGTSSACSATSSSMAGRSRSTATRRASSE
ncbi:MAG: helix-turn-helix domain-containing protein [Sandaracinaceae bacterium]|nr:helix-turn-helix domain-containing protein [Sandaracinaceae bacterium]